MEILEESGPGLEETRQGTSGPVPEAGSGLAVEDSPLETVLNVFEHEDIVAAMRSLPERWRTVLWQARTKRGSR